MADDEEDDLEDEEDEEDEKIYYYIHNWAHCPTAPARISDAQSYIVLLFRNKLQQMLQVSPVDKPVIFFHNYLTEFSPTVLTNDVTVNSFLRESTQSHVRQTLGCGHLLLCFLYHTFDKMAKLNGEDWQFHAAWEKCREEAENDKLMDMSEECNPEKVYSWVQHVFENEFFRQKMQESSSSSDVDDRLTVSHLRAHFVTDSAFTVATKEFDNIYGEFLALHLHIFAVLGLLKDTSYVKLYCWLFRFKDAPLLSDNFLKNSAKKFDFNRVWGGATLKALIRFKRLLLELRNGGGKKLKKLKTTTAGTQTSTTSSTTSKTTARTTTIKVSESTIKSIKLVMSSLSKTDWSATQPPEASHRDWTEMSDQAGKKTWTKMIGQQWRLGCDDCTTDYDEVMGKDGVVRPCRWVTVKQIVAVKRLVKKVKKNKK